MPQAKTLTMAIEFEFISADSTASSTTSIASAADNETMWLLGSLAAQIVEEAKADNWTNLKAQSAQPS